MRLQSLTATYQIGECEGSNFNYIVRSWIQKGQPNPIQSKMKKKLHALLIVHSIILTLD